MERSYKFLSRSEAESVIINHSKEHYVYLLGTPSEKPFYAGKGSGTRLFHHEAEARNNIRPSHKLNTIRKIIRNGGALTYALPGFYGDEAAALEAERALITRLGRHDLGFGPLTNQTDGGEGTSNPSEDSRRRRLATLGGDSEDPERQVINQFFADISGSQASVPIKPLAGWRNARPLRLTDRRYGPTPRSARAIVATAAANGIVLEPGVILPRLLVVNDTEYLIENGCGDALIKSKMAELAQLGKAPREEQFVLSRMGFDYVCAELGKPRLVDLGVLEP